MPLERKVPIHYLDGVYDLSGYDRPNVLVISNLTFEGLTGRGSDRRTSLFTFYGKKPLNADKILPLLIRSASCRGSIGCSEARLSTRI